VRPVNDDWIIDDFFIAARAIHPESFPDEDQEEEEEETDKKGEN